MNNVIGTRPVPRSAFTLIELLVVIAVIMVLAGLIFPVMKVTKTGRLKKVARAELAQMVIAIESFKAKTGYYPPDNPGSAISNLLYFELGGSVLTNNVFWTLDGRGHVNSTALPGPFGAAGVANCSTTTRSSDDAIAPGRFLPANLKPNQYAFLVDTPPTAQIPVLVCTADASTGPVDGNPRLNPWRYKSSNPTNNPGAYDLWVDLLIDGKTNRISNWSKEPQIVSD